MSNTEQANLGAAADGTVITKGDAVGQIMNGRQYVGTLYDSEFNEIQVWYQPVNNQYFRGASANTIGDRTIAYGNWSYLTTAGMAHVRKLKAFMDKMLPPERRDPDYHSLRQEIPVNSLIPSRDDAPVFAGPLKNKLEGGNPGVGKQRADGTGGVVGVPGAVVQNRRRWDDQDARAANELITDLWVQLKAVGFSQNELQTNYYTEWFQDFSIRLDDRVLYNYSMSHLRAQNEVSEALDAINWPLSQFEPAEFQFPVLLGGDPSWLAFAPLPSGARLAFRLDYSASKLTFKIV
jgi:hypothetical protein